MKTTILLSLMFAGVTFAGFEKWTNKDGKTADLELIKVVEKDGEKAGEFKMRSGKTVTLKASDLSEEAAEKLEAWEPPAAVIDGKPSVFDEAFDGNLVKVDGKSLKKYEMTERPKKYYVFYYTASWCPPCQQYTPSLVDFYNEHKSDNFELVLITADRDEAAMEKYAVEKKMPWPQLKFSESPKFQKEFEQGVGGYPSVIVTDLKGKVLGNYRDLAALEKLVK
jgi:thiol-disulfide isomerase/thioredoxin